MESAFEPVPLSRRECLALLGRKSAGRIALSFHSMPTILPVRYELDAGGVLVDAAAEPPVQRALLDNVVTFQVDELDGADDLWSVTVTGIAHPHEPLHHHRGHLVSACIATTILSGTRLLGVGH